MMFKYFTIAILMNLEKDKNPYRIVFIDELGRIVEEVDGNTSDYSYVLKLEKMKNPQFEDSLVKFVAYKNKRNYIPRKYHCIIDDRNNRYLNKILSKQYNDKDLLYFLQVQVQINELINKV